MSLRDFSQTGSAYSFLDTTLDVSAERLIRQGTEVKLRPKSFQVLRYLADRAGRLVTREELLSAIWPDTAVTDESLTKCIADIRKALDDESQRVIRTVPRRGYLFAAAVTRTLEFPRPADAVSDASGAGGGAPIGRPSQRSLIGIVGAPGPRGSSLWLGTVVLVCVAAAFAFVSLRTPRSVSARTPSAAQDYVRLTNFTDAAFSPALSPDGRMLAFIRGVQGPTGIGGGRGDIFVKALPDGEPVQLTRDGRSKMTPVFTPAGDRITFGYHALMTDPQNWSTWTVSVLGGDPKPLLHNASALSWIPESSPPRVLFSRVGAGVHMSIVTATERGDESRVLYSPSVPNAMAHRSFLSPDGKQMLVVEMQGGWRPCRLVPIEPSAGLSAGGGLVGPSAGQCSSAAWSPDGAWMYMSVNTGEGYHIWRQRFPNGIPEQVTFGATEEQEVAFTPGGRSFVTSIGTRQSTLWLHDPRGEHQITSEGFALLPEFAPDGKTLYYLMRSRTSRQYVSGELWSANLETGRRERLLPGYLLTHYSIGRNNRIAFVASSDTEEATLWVARLDGRTPPRQLSAMHTDRAFFGADGDVFFVAVGEDGRRFLYRVNEDGSGVRKALPDAIINVYDASPGGEAVAAWMGAVVKVLPLDGASAVDVSTVCASAGGENRGATPSCVRWSPDGRFLYLNDRAAGQIYTLPVPAGKVLPPVPEGGITSSEQAASLPGATIIREPTAFVGPDPSVYAYLRLTAHRNIYQVHVPEPITN